MLATRATSLVGLLLVVLVAFPAAAGVIALEPDYLLRTDEYPGVQDRVCPERLRLDNNALSINRFGQVQAIRTCVVYDDTTEDPGTSRVQIDIALAAPPGATGDGVWRCFVNTALSPTRAPVARAEACDFTTDDQVAVAPEELYAFPVGFSLAADERTYLLELIQRHCADQTCEFLELPDVRGVHEANIRRMVGLGIMGACRTDLSFCPGAPVTRADMADFLARALGIPDPGGSPFPDVPDTHPSAAAVRAIASRGITVGTAEGNFAPDVPVRRDQMATFLTKAFALSATASSTFDDVPANHVHHDGVVAVAAAGITVGCGEAASFCPGDLVIRAQMASFVTKATG